MAEHQLRRLAWWLDEAFRIPGTRQRVGFDALIGLIPGVGDTFGALLSTYIIVEAARRGASTWTVARMLGNVAVETLFGAFPIVGDLFDVVFKANQRNMALLGDTLERDALPRDPQRVLRVAVVLIGLTMLIVLGLTFALSITIARWLEQQPQVERVYHPSLQSHPQHRLAMAQQSGQGGAVTSFVVRGGRAAAFQVIDVP